MDAILIVVPSSERIAELLGAMREAGAPGATVNDCQGMEFLAWLGGHPSVSRYLGLEGHDRQGGKTVLSIVPEHVTPGVLAAVERVLDGFSAPYSGMLCTWKVGHFRCYMGDKPSLVEVAR